MFAAINSFLTGALAKVTDVYWPFVSMLLHGDSPQQFDQDTSTNAFPISDSAVPNYSVASMQASTRTPFTGGPSSNGSGFFNGTNAGLTTPANTAFALGATSTTEMWLYATSSATQRIIGNYQGGLGFDVLLVSGGLLYVAGGGANATATFPLNIWTHLAVVYTSGTLKIYFNGISQTLTGTTTGYNFTATDPVYIGNNVGTSQFFSGYLSNVRVVKGVAVYTGAFTPPTASLAATQSSGTNISAITGTQTSLLTLQTNVPQNNNQFFDTSTNNFTVTRNGNTTQGSFNPFTPTYPYSVATNGGSAYFDGSGDYLSLTANAAFTIPSSTSFTIEAWIYITNLSYANGNIICANQQASSGYLFLYNPTIGLRFYAGSGTVDINQGSVTGWTANTWYHVAAVRNGASAITLYRNGVSVATGSSTSSFGTGTFYVGGSPSDSAYMNGYISNFRLVNGTAVYTTTFTPPTAPLTAVTNTALLLGMSNAAIFDNAELNNLETVGNSQISTSTFKYGTGALKFGGTSTDYMPTRKTSAFVLGSGDFTIECWVNFASSTANGYFAGDYDGTSQFNFYMWANAGAMTSTWKDQASGTNKNCTSSAGAIVINTWYHIAFVRDGNTNRQYINGVQNGTISVAGLTADTNANPLAIGAVGSVPTAPYFNGYIDDFRFTKGICRYPSGTTFTPPTAAFPNQGPFAYPIGYPTQRAIFGYGSTGAYVSITNLVSNAGVVATDTTGVGTARGSLAAASYGGDKAIFGYGYSGSNVSITNLVSNTGVVSTDVTGVGTARYSLAAAGYGGGKAIFGYGYTTADVSLTNLVSSTGVVATDTTGVGTARTNLAAAGYGLDKAIFGYGLISGVTRTAITNLVSNTGVVATDTTGVGTIRDYLAAASYGVGKAIFGYGYDNFGAGVISMTNLVSTTGVVATDTTGVGTARYLLAAAAYGGDRAIFGYGNSGASVSMTNLVSNTGVVATDTTGVGTARYVLAAAGYSA